MASLALQLFVNLNKILGQFPGASPGANYTKQLIDRLKVDHAQLLACSDPTNAHTQALSAFALGVGLKELRAQNIEQADALAPALAHALAIADEGLEQLGEEEVHLVLTAHEYYKAHCNGKGGCDDYSRATWGKARSATDQIPLATVQGPMQQDALGWRPSSMNPATTHAAPSPPVEFAGAAAFDEDITHLAPVSQMDFGSIALPDIDLSTTGVSSFLTEEVIPPMASDEDDTQEQDPVAEAYTIEEVPEPEVAMAVPGILQTPPPSPSAGIRAATLHPIRRDLSAEREFTNTPSAPGELVEETVTAWGKRQRAMAKQEDVPMGGWQGALAEQHNRGRPLGRYAHDLPSEMEDSQVSGASETYDSTFMHSESAPDRQQRRPRQPDASRRRTLMLWALAPLCLALPPVAFFQAGVLWNQGRKGHSALLMGLGVIGAAVFVLIGLQKI
jgi:hypothetical protein